uniref:RNA-directed RNA polymerase catalytic subunit n=1 Tax=Acropora cnidenomovirus 1 TaxID=3057082 RepID=A0AA95NRM6_9VIRU|nr:MAG: polymerase basic 1 [Acropora cnidenomovirus 1]
MAIAGKAGEKRKMDMRTIGEWSIIMTAIQDVMEKAAKVINDMLKMQTITAGGVEHTKLIVDLLSDPLFSTMRTTHKDGDKTKWNICLRKQIFKEFITEAVKDMNPVIKLIFASGIEMFFNRYKLVPKLPLFDSRGFGTLVCISEVDYSQFGEYHRKACPEWLFNRIKNDVIKYNELLPGLKIVKGNDEMCMGGLNVWSTVIVNVVNQCSDPGVKSVVQSDDSLTIMTNIEKDKKLMTDERSVGINSNGAKTTYHMEVDGPVFSEMCTKYFDSFRETVNPNSSIRKLNYGQLQMESGYYQSIKSAAAMFQELGPVCGYMAMYAGERIQAKMNRMLTDNEISKYVKKNELTNVNPFTTDGTVKFWRAETMSTNPLVQWGVTTGNIETVCAMNYRGTFDDEATGLQLYREKYGQQPLYEGTVPAVGPYTLDRKGSRKFDKVKKANVMEEVERSKLAKKMLNLGYTLNPTGMMSRYNADECMLGLIVAGLERKINEVVDIDEMRNLQTRLVQICREKKVPGYH